jgi:hypothetical protein
MFQSQKRQNSLSIRLMDHCMISSPTDKTHSMANRLKTPSFRGVKRAKELSNFHLSLIPF